MARSQSTANGLKYEPFVSRCRQIRRRYVCIIMLYTFQCSNTPDAAGGDHNIMSIPYNSIRELCFFSFTVRDDKYIYTYTHIIWSIVANLRVVNGGPHFAAIMYDNIITTWSYILHAEHCNNMHNTRTWALHANIILISLLSYRENSVVS